ncbi:metal ABC transporter solute-binding protein, Zn/Mn family [Indioceanicola profundi]|uniref:metal ABC transporter solute-binding protein, Zn/Mn family n=1 Tax=Indioceanicola profundi TaxID=2220096 RepID=UPI000E6AC786|nr:zinc ABC transporter substrate-binding protein [Indioceanicola profundi]
MSRTLPRFTGHDLSRRRLLALAAATAAGALLPARAWAKPAIVATTGQVADMVRIVAASRAEVTGLLQEGIDPHTYKLTRSDIGRLMAADAVFYNGLLLEGKMTDALLRIGGSGKPVHAVSEWMPKDRLLAPAEFEGQYDPHVWMDVALWTQAMDGVVEALSKLDPDGVDGFRANEAAYGTQLRRLHDYAGQVLSSVPDAARVLVTAHDAFNYLGRAYGVEVVGIQGLSTESEAGLQRVEEIVSMLVDRKIPAVFVETSVTDRNVRALIEGAASRGHKVVIGGSLFSDAMGAPGTYEGTYVGMIDHNVTTIARALGGDAPAGGFQGRLARAG